MTGDVRLGFLGAGMIVRNALAPAVHAASGVVLQAAAARDPERARALEPAGGVHGDYRALLADPDVDVVYVGLDNAGHLPWALAALEAGKHVLCEKPIALDPAALETLVAAAREADRLLVEAFWYRWHPRTRRLEQLLAQGALGPLSAVEADFSFAGAGDGDPRAHYRLDPDRGGGALYDVGCYALSAAHLAFGARLKPVSAIRRGGPTGVDLQSWGELRMPDGAGASIGCGMSGLDRQVVSVTGAAARVDFGAPAFTALDRPADLSITTPDGAVRTESFAPVNPYRLMVEAVAARVRGEDAFLPGLEHSRQVAASTAGLFALMREREQ
jgi:predicted dehydrogenase